MPRKRAGASRPTAPDGHAPTALSVQHATVHATGSRFAAPLEEIAPSPRNVREEWEYEEEDFELFRANIAKNGAIQDGAVVAIEVYLEKYPNDSKKFGENIKWVLLAGERRWMAHRENGDEDMIVVLRNDLFDRGDLAFLSENGFRRGFNPLQDGKLFARIEEEEGLSYAQIAEELGGTAKSRDSDKARITKCVRLYRDFPPGPNVRPGPARLAIHKGHLGLEPAYHLLTQLGTEELIERAYALMTSQSLTARAVVKQLLAPSEPESTPDAVADGDSDSIAGAVGGLEKTQPALSAVDGKRPERMGGGRDGEELVRDPSDGASLNSVSQPAGPSPAPGSGPTPASKDDPDRSGPASTDLEAAAAARRRARQVSAVRKAAAARTLAGQQLLKTRDYSVGDDLAVRLATGLLLTAGKQMVAITAALAGLSSDETMAASTLPRSEWVRRLANDNDATTIVRVGDAAALAVSELLIRDTAPDGWGEHQAAYLRLLSEQGGYVPTGEEEAFLQAAGRPDSPRSEE